MTNARLDAPAFEPFSEDAPELLRAVASTEAQREIWTACQMGTDAACAYNESVSLLLHGPLQVAELRRALSALVAQHDALHSTFDADGNWLLVERPRAAELGSEDLRRLEPEARERRCSEVLREEVETPFDLRKGPLIRARLLRLTDRASQLILSAHHIVCDGWSIAVLLPDLAELYSAAVASRPVTLAEGRPRFSDYAEAEQLRSRTPAYAASEHYWLQRFTGELPALDLPVDLQRPKLKSYNARREDYVLDAALVQQLKRLGQKSGASFFVTMLGAFQVLLSRLSRQRDVIVAIPAAGQPVSGQTQLVGHCVSTLPIRQQVEMDAKLGDVLKELRSAVLDAYEHQQVTLGSLLKRLSIARDPSRLPLTPVLFNVDQTVRGETLAFSGLTAEFSVNPRHFETFELFVNAVESHGKVVLETQYNTDLFSRELILAWLNAFECLLRAAVAEPDRPVGQLELVSSTARGAFAAWNATAAAYDREAPVHVGFEAQVARTPDAIAVQCGDESLSYAALNASANRLARALRSMGVRRDVLVGIGLSRGVDLLIAMLAVHKAGGAYVPLDPSFPRDRLRFMIEDSGLRVLITEEGLRKDLVDPHERAAVMGTGVLCMDAASERPTIDAHAASDLTGEDPDADAHGTSLAYVIYTSGSTGQPKGVRVHHAAVVNFLDSMAERPGLTAHNALLAVTTLSFDISVLELQLPLRVGARIVLATSAQASDGSALKQLIETHRVDFMQATPATWRLLQAAGFKGGKHFKALCGGEAFPRDLAHQLITCCGEVWNVYGPTETTVWSTVHQLRTSDERILIGRPIRNTRCYVLDEQLHQVPVGAVGELHIGGDGVSRGYHQRPELTAARFIDDPFCKGAKLYKTGDLARYLPDGSLECLGRTDHQVKVRGYRIELGELEAVLQRHPAVREAAVIVREDRPGDVRLVAYAARAEGQPWPDDEHLRRHLRQSVPDYMVPQHFVELTSLPRTPNGKIDRKRLPAPTGEVQQSPIQYVAPRNETEATIASIWQRVLGRTRVGIHDNFFHLGGHSLLAAQAMSQLARELDLELSMRKLFEAPTVAQLAQSVDADKQKGRHAQRIQRAASDGPAPLSLMQQRLWFLEDMNPGTAVYNLPSAFRMRGSLDQNAMERALSAIARRHDVLRSVVRWEGRGAVQEVVLDDLAFDLTPLDLSHVEAELEREAELRRALEGAANEPFDITQGPLVRARLFRLAPEHHVLFFMAHHIIWDGWSFDLFLAELDAHYAAFLRGAEPVVPELPIRYRDFASWHRSWLQGDELSRQEQYWLRRLSGELPVLELPADRPRPAQMTFRGKTLAFELSRELCDALTEVGQRQDATFYMVLMAAFKALLHRYTGQSDLVVGTPIRGRNWSETERLIGFFVNTLALRTQLDPEASFNELLRRVRQNTLEAFGHADMPFELLIRKLGVERDLSRTPVMQAFFTFQDVRNRDSRFGDLPYSQVNVHADVTPTDLNIWVKQGEDKLVGGLDYYADIFSEQTAQRMLDSLLLLLRGVAAQPDAPVWKLPIMPEADRALVRRWRTEPARHPHELSLRTRLHQLVEQHADRTPDKEAVVDGRCSLTYAALERRANRIAHHLHARGVGPNVLVGLFVERSAEALCALLGILKAGGAYVPLDPALPHERLQFILKDTCAAYLVTQRSLEHNLPAHDGERIFYDDLPPGLSDARPDRVCAAEDCAYVIYTSGSTGTPKGVLTPHRAVVSYLAAAAERPGIAPHHRVLALSTWSFDMSIMDLFMPLSVGGTVVVCDRETALDGDLLLEMIDEHDVNYFTATPATFQLLLAAGWEGGRHMHVNCGGEAWGAELGRRLSACCGEVWNIYGPTETTVLATACAYHPAMEEIPLGPALPNARLAVVDRHDQVAPIGVSGELLIGGDGLALGYLHRPELNAERFVELDVDGTGTSRWYRSGDLVRLRADGQLYYAGRNDHQVKLRGYRIELGEIEAALNKHPEVDSAVVIVREDKPGDRRLVAYLVPKARKKSLRRPCPTTVSARRSARLHAASALRQPGQPAAERQW